MSSHKFMSPNSSLDNLFHSKINPIKKYILKGDKTPIKEISSSHLNRIIFKNSNKENNYIKTNTLFSIGNQNNQNVFDNSLIQIIEDENDKLNQNSKEYLYNLFEEGVANSDENRNTNIFLSDSLKRTYKLEDNNPYIYSLTECHPFSMFYKTRYKELIKKDGTLALPAPRFINSDIWMKEPDLSFDNIFKGININDETGLISKDPETMKKFEGLITNIIGQLLRVPFGHHMSIQVKIFEPLTVHEKYINAFAYANKFLIPASNPNLDTYSRFKFCVSFVFSGIYIPIGMLKPFNPFLGETYQGELPNGAKLYIEQVTHSPLVARYYIIYKKVYEISGYWDLSVKAVKFGTQMAICQKGPIYIKFPQLNECIIGHYPEIRMINLISDDRANLYYGNMVFLDIKNNYKAIIKINPNPKCFHEVIGSIINYKYGDNFVYNYEQEWEFGKKYEVGNEDKNGYELIDSISGSWLSRLVIGEQKTWDIHEQLPEFIRPVKSCIPSDGRFREDLIWLFRSFYCSKNEEEKKIYLDLAQEWKIMMEEFNRWERKRRAENKKKKK